jgi:hypothetical protein
VSLLPLARFSSYCLSQVLRDKAVKKPGDFIKLLLRVNPGIMKNTKCLNGWLSSPERKKRMNQMLASAPFPSAYSDPGLSRPLFWIVGKRRLKDKPLAGFGRHIWYA